MDIYFAKQTDARQRRQRTSLQWQQLEDVATQNPLLGIAVPVRNVGSAQSVEQLENPLLAEPSPIVVLADNST